MGFLDILAAAVEAVQTFMMIGGAAIVIAGSLRILLARLIFWMSFLSGALVTGVIAFVLFQFGLAIPGLVVLAVGLLWSYIRAKIKAAMSTIKGITQIFFGTGVALFVPMVRSGAPMVVAWLGISLAVTIGVFFVRSRLQVRELQPATPRQATAEAAPVAPPVPPSRDRPVVLATAALEAEGTTTVRPRALARVEQEAYCPRCKAWRSGYALDCSQCGTSLLASRAEVAETEGAQLRAQENARALSGEIVEAIERIGFELGRSSHRNEIALRELTERLAKAEAEVAALAKQLASSHDVRIGEHREIMVRIEDVELNLLQSAERAKQVKITR